MKRIFIVLLMLPLAVFGQYADSVDVSDYDISLDLRQRPTFRGDATITLRLTRPCTSIKLELLGTADSIWVADSPVAGVPNLAAVPTEGLAADSTFTIRVCYHANGFVEGNGWGGFHRDGGMDYNLGVGFYTDPHPLGRAVFPCRDNLTDKATYTLRITAADGWTAECSGDLDERTTDANGNEYSVWRVEQPVCTYMVGISQAPFSRIETTTGGYPLTIAHTALQDSATLRAVFALLDSVVPAFERCFGPYRWGRIGYVPTAMGSMEHVNNIALAQQAAASISPAGQSTIAHELGHAWFGNLVTCADEGDMWINEGGASFCSEVAEEATNGKAASLATYQTNLERVVRSAHTDDGGQYRPLHGMPHQYTYGTTTYDKGALVWHSLRGYLGDELFYTAMQRLFASCAFGNLDAATLRDSLSLYTGVNLDAFFDFHVFGEGFVDYHASMTTYGCVAGSANVNIEQQGVGTSRTMGASRVPIAVYGANGESRLTELRFHGTDTTVQVVVPFAPAFVVLDPECRMSDAATYEKIVVAPQTEHNAAHCHFRLRAADDASQATYHVEHHWGNPGSDELPEGVLRTANRYWVINSLLYANDGLRGMFHYVRGNYTGGSYPGLDKGFIKNTATIDSLALLWRPKPYSPWEVVSRHYTNISDGYMTMDGLRAGEYTLAIVDPAAFPQTGIATTESTARFTLFPNPVRQGDELSIDLPEGGEYEMSIIATDSHTVLHREHIVSGQTFTAPTTAGTYLVKIENKYVSLQSKLIVL